MNALCGLGVGACEPDVGGKFEYWPCVGVGGTAAYCPCCPGPGPGYIACAWPTGTGAYPPGYCCCCWPGCAYPAYGDPMGDMGCAPGGGEAGGYWYPPFSPGGGYAPAPVHEWPFELCTSLSLSALRSRANESRAPTDSMLERREPAVAATAAAVAAMPVAGGDATRCGMADVASAFACTPFSCGRFGFDSAASAEGLKADGGARSRGGRGARAIACCAADSWAALSTASSELDVTVLSPV